MNLYDPLDSDVRAWFPADRDTAKLVAALLACRDIVRLLDGLGERPLDDHHGLLLLCTPAISLADHTTGLHASMGRYDTSRWPAHDRRNLQDWGRSLRRLASGPLRRLRNTLSAHHEPNSFGRGGVSVREVAPLVLKAIPQSLCVLVLLLNHEGVFRWSRQPNVDREDVLQFHGTNPYLAPTFRVEGDRIVELVKLTLAQDPREDALATLKATLDAYNTVAERARLPRVHLFEGDRGAA